MHQKSLLRSRAGIIKPLIEALSDKHTSVRNYAATGLASVLRSLYPYRRFDLQTAGYDYNAPETLRRAAVKRIRTWWTTHRDRDW